MNELAQPARGTVEPRVGGKTHEFVPALPAERVVRRDAPLDVVGVQVLEIDPLRGDSSPFTIGNDLAHCEALLVSGSLAHKAPPTAVLSRVQPHQPNE